MARVSVMTVADGVDPERLRASLTSVAAQTSPDVEHVVLLARTPHDEVASVLAGWGGPVVDASAVDAEFRWATGLAATTAQLVLVVTGEGVLRPDTVEVMTDAMADEADVVYGDTAYGDTAHGDTAHGDSELDISEWVERTYPPDFSPERLRHHDYLSGVMLFRRSLLGTDVSAVPLVPGAERHDLALRVTEVARAVVHVPRALVRFPVDLPVEGIVDPEATCLVIERHCVRLGIDARAEWRDGRVRLTRRLDRRPVVSVVIPTRGGEGEVFGEHRCFVVEAVRSLVERSTYGELEFVVVYDAVTPTDVLERLRSLAGDALVLVPFDEPFNFSRKVDLGVEHSTGPLVLLLNDDTELVDPASVEVMVGHLSDPDVAMVGAKLLFEDGRLQHGGHVYNQSVHHLCLGWPGESRGPADVLAVARECSGVTAAAALVRRSVFDEVGGFEHALPLNYNDVDFSLKIRAAGHRIVWTPWASWYHFESRTRDSTLHPEEVEFVRRRWRAELDHDPYYHPALPPDAGDWQQARAAIAPAPSALRRVRSRVGRLLPRRRLRRPHGVNLIGYLDATSGLGERARVLEHVLRSAGLAHSVWNLDAPQSERVDRSGPPNPDDGTIFDTTIAVVTALAFPVLDGAYRPLVREVDRVIGYWFWELEHIPASHRPAIDMVDEIWAPTRFVRDAYAAACDRPVELVPLPISEPVPSSRDRESFGFAADEFVFLTSFDFLSAIERKNPVGVIDAFRQAFPNGDERVRLAIKSINGHRRRAEMRRLDAARRDDPRIELLDVSLTAGDQAALIAAADCFVSLHRSEGLGLHIAEAMWLGTPVVATDYSGSTDLTDPADDGAVAELVDARLVPVVGGGEAYQAGEWAEPDLDRAAAAMRRCAADDLSGLTERARRRMQAQADVSLAGTSVRSLLDPATRRDRRRP